MSEVLYKEHFAKVPLDYDDHKKGHIHVFAREAYYKGNEKADIYVFLQGGPGFSSPRNTNTLPAFKILLKKYRVLLFDQRGTGLSTKIGPEIAENKSAIHLADYFSCFRANQIVSDLEYFREHILKVKKWFLIAQSYGGFITFSYLSFYPKSIKGAIICGGIPPLTCKSVNEIYDHLTDFIIERNSEYYQKYPKDKKAVSKIVDMLLKEPYKLPDGGFLTAERFLDIGMTLGQTNGITKLHNILEDPYIDYDKKRISYWFAKNITDQTSFETNPIYAVLHESIYCNGVPSNWAADSNLKNKKPFQLNKPPYYFFGETIRKNMFQEYKMLRPYQKAADIIARKKNWGLLYDLKTLSENKVPVEAIAYQTDYFVNYHLSKETLKLVPNIKVWSHPDYQHDSIRVHSTEIIEKLFNKLEKRIY